MIQAMKIPDAKAAVGKEWEKLEKLPAWQLNKVNSKEEASVISKMRSWKQNYRSVKAEWYSEVTL